MTSQTSDKKYKEDAAKAQTKNNFKVTEGDTYLQAKKVSKATSIKNYKKSGEEAMQKFKVCIKPFNYRVH